MNDFARQWWKKNHANGFVRARLLYSAQDRYIYILPADANADAIIAVGQIRGAQR